MTNTQGLAAEKHVYKQTIYAERGGIVDANNDVLADNVPVQTVVADATHVTDPDAVCDLLSAELKIPAAEIAEKLRGDRRYIVVKRGVPEAVAETLRSKLRAGICAGFISNTIRPGFIPTDRCYAT